MECFPACRTCTGLCKSDATPPEPKPIRKSTRGSFFHSSYFELECGHYTTPEDQTVWSMWKPKRGLSWCDDCNAWKPKRKVSRETLPEEPLF